MSSLCLKLLGGTTLTAQWSILWSVKWSVKWLVKWVSTWGAELTGSWLRAEAGVYYWAQDGISESVISGYCDFECLYGYAEIWWYTMDGWRNVWMRMILGSEMLGTYELGINGWKENTWLPLWLQLQYWFTCISTFDLSTYSAWTLSYFIKHLYMLLIYWYLLMYSSSRTISMLNALLLPRFHWSQVSGKPLRYRHFLPISALDDDGNKLSLMRILLFSEIGVFQVLFMAALY